MAHSLTLSSPARLDRRQIRRTADAVEVERRRPSGREPVAPRPMSRSEWLGAAALWAFVALFVAELAL